MFIPIWRVFLWGFALYLLALGTAALLAPQHARRFLRGFAANWRNNFLEAALRGLVGLAFVGAAATTRAPHVSRVIGLFLFVTAVLMAFLPRLHARFAPRATRFVFTILPWFGLLAIVLAGLVGWFIH